MATRVGDFFLVPLGNGRSGVGYVLDKGNPALFLGGLNVEVDRESDVRPEWLSDIGKFVVFGSFLPVKLKNGDWRIIGNLPPDRSMYPKPYHKIKMGDHFYVESFGGERVRKAAPEDILTYDFRTNRSAMIFQNALNALVGHRDWDPKYEKVKAEHVFRQSRLHP